MLSRRRTSCRSLAFRGQLCLINCNIPHSSLSHLSIQEDLFSFFISDAYPHLVTPVFYSLSQTKHHLHRTFCREETCHPWHLQIRYVGDCADRFRRLCNRVLRLGIIQTSNHYIQDINHSFFNCCAFFIAVMCSKITGDKYWPKMHFYVDISFLSKSHIASYTDNEKRYIKIYLLIEYIFHWTKFLFKLRKNKILFLVNKQ